MFSTADYDIRWARICNSFFSTHAIPKESVDGVLQQQNRGHRGALYNSDALKQEPVLLQLFFESVLLPYHLKIYLFRPKYRCKFPEAVGSSLAKMLIGVISVSICLGLTQSDRHSCDMALAL